VHSVGVVQITNLNVKHSQPSAGDRYGSNLMLDEEAHDKVMSTDFIIT
jgi:hypothetical protein